MKAIWILPPFMLLGPVGGTSADILVSPQGRTLAEALKESRKAEPGAARRIIVHGGRYFLSEPLVLDARDEGLIIEAAPGEKAVLFGGRRITGWQPDGGPFWAAPLPAASSGEWDFRMLVVNDRFAARARLPETGTFTHLSEFKVRWMGTNGGGWERKPTEEELTTLRYRPGDLGPWLNLANAELTVYHMWDESLVRLRAHDEATQTLTFANPAGHPPGAFGVQKYVVWNVREGMTKPGQWYLDRAAGKLVYWPLPGENMSAADVIAPALESVIRIEGRKGAPARNITVRGLTLAVTNTPAVSGGFGAGRYDGAISVNWAEDCQVTGLTVYNVGGQAIKAQNTVKLTVAENEVYSAGAGGIIARGLDARIEDNHVHHVGVTYPSAIGIYCGGERLRVRHNEVHDTPYTAINCGGAGHHIEHNLIYRAMLELHDGAAFYTIFGKDIIVRGNLVRDIPDTGGYGSSAYYLDELSENCLVEGNVSVNVARPSHNHIGRRNTLRNNIFITEGEMVLTFPKSEGYTFSHNVLHAGGQITFRMPPEAIAAMPNNLIHSGAGRVIVETLAAYGSQEKHPFEPRDGTLLADPLLDEEKEGVYRFRAGSPASELGILPVDVSKAGRRTSSGEQPGIMRKSL